MGWGDDDDEEEHVDKPSMPKPPPNLPAAPPARQETKTLCPETSNPVRPNDHTLTDNATPQASSQQPHRDDNRRRTGRRGPLRREDRREAPEGATATPDAIVIDFGAMLDTGPSEMRVVTTDELPRRGPRKRRPKHRDKEKRDAARDAKEGQRRRDSSKQDSKVEPHQRQDSTPFAKEAAQQNDTKGASKDERQRDEKRSTRRVRGHRRRRAESDHKEEHAGVQVCKTGSTTALEPNESHTHELTDEAHPNSSTTPAAEIVTNDETTKHDAPRKGGPSRDVESLERPEPCRRITKAPVHTKDSCAQASETHSETCRDVPEAAVPFVASQHDKSRVDEQLDAKRELRSQPAHCKPPSQADKATKVEPTSFVLRVLERTGIAKPTATSWKSRGSTVLKSLKLSSMSRQDTPAPAPSAEDSGVIDCGRV